MMSLLSRTGKTGQSLAEYGLLIAIVSLGALVALSVLGGSISQSVDTMRDGNGQMGGITGGGSPGGGGGAQTTNYPTNYNVGNASDVAAYYDTGTSKFMQMGYGERTICGTEAGKTAVERCKRLMGEDIVTQNPDGSTTTESADGTVVTEMRNPDGSSWKNTTQPDGTRISESYGADGSSNIKTTYPDGSSVERQTTVAEDGTRTTVTITTDRNGNVTIS